MLNSCSNLTSAYADPLKIFMLFIVVKFEWFMHYFECYYGLTDCVEIVDAKFIKEDFYTLRFSIEFDTIIHFKCKEICEYDFFMFAII